MSAVRLHVECEGDGPAVVLAHGFAGSARNWRPQARALAMDHRVCRFDARGHARSEAPSDAAAYSVDAFVQDLGSIVEQTGAERVVVGGLSMGAAIALEWAARHPDRARGVVLASLPAGAGAGEGLSTIAMDLADAIERDGVEAAGARFVWGRESGLDAAAARLVRQGFLEHPAHGLVGTLRGVIAHLPEPGPLAARLATAGVSMLVIAGAGDRSAVRTSRRLVAVAPAARLVVLGGAGHVVNLERSDEFTTVLREWLLALT